MCFEAFASIGDSSFQSVKLLQGFAKSIKVEEFVEKSGDSLYLVESP